MGTSIHTKCAAAKAVMETTPLCQAISAMAEPMLALVGLNHGPPPVGSPLLTNSPNPAVRDSAAVQEANAIKQQEDAAPAKIAAIQYLAGVDCKCYKGVKKALLEALLDCNEGVRFEAAKALGSACCCDKEVQKILEEVANKQDEFGNYKEWSVRVRAAAAQSAAACAGIIPREATGVETPETPPIEVPPAGEIPLRPQAKRGFFQRDKQAAAISVTSDNGAWAAQEKKEITTFTRDLAMPPVQARTRTEPLVASRQESAKPDVPVSLRQAAATREDMKQGTTPQTSQVLNSPSTRVMAPPVNIQKDSIQKDSINQPTMKPAAHLDPVESKEDPDNGDLMGTISYVDVKTGSVRLTFTDGDQPRAGTRADVFHKFLLRTQHLGELEIIGSSDGATLARPTGDLTIRQLNKGDRVFIHK
jgi:hypothetical protein